MAKDTNTPLTPMPLNSGEIVLYQPDGTINLEVRIADDTVWLSQAQIADLSGT